MRTRRHLRTQWLVFVCVCLILSVALLPLLSHTHTCTGESCDLCALIRSSRELLLGAVLLMVFHVVADATHAPHTPPERTTARRDSTLVGRRVKLSD